MKIFITGASGFIGGAAARMLRKKHEVVAMARNDETWKRISGLGVTPIRSELNAATVEHLDGCEVVIHCAAYVEAWGTPEQYWSLNVDGTKQLLEVARAAGVRRFIHISTEAVSFDGRSMNDIDERHPYAEDSPFLYPKTKAIAEQMALDANVEGSFETIALRPRFVWGPGDNSILPEVLKMARAGRFVWLDEGSAVTSTTHINNFVHAIELALTQGRGGQAYLIADDGVITLRELITRLLQTQDVEVPEKSIPSAVLRPIAWLVETVWRLLGLRPEPPINRFSAAVLSTNSTVNTQKAKTELGYEPVISRAEGLSTMPKLGNL
jgi:hypothetical protein